jgi:putative glutamine amidotransferase
MAAKFLMSRKDYAVATLLRKLGYQEVNNLETPDFIVFGGGVDVSPALYNEATMKGTHFDEDTDYQDFCTVIAAKLKSIPRVGICRGMQLLHVAQGGTLIQHINGHAGPMHTLLTEEEDPIAGWEDIKINSHHHQCVPIEEVDYAKEVYVSHEGTTEVIVATNLGWLGVQYHPEYATCPAEGVDFFAELMKHKLGAIL